MKYLAPILFLLLFYACDENAPKKKELFTQEEQKIINENIDIVKYVKDIIHEDLSENELKVMLLYAFKAVKLDTTIYKNKNFEYFNGCIDYSNNHELYDSLLDEHYGIKTEKIEGQKYAKLYGIDKIDSIIFPKKHMFPPTMRFKEMMRLIEEKHHYTYKKDICEKAYWEEREISFYRDQWRVFKTKTKWEEIRAIDPMNRTTKANTFDQFILDYCKYKNRLSITFVEPSIVFTQDFYNKIDTVNMMPIVLNFDSLGVLTSLSSNSKKYDTELFKRFSVFNGKEQFILLNKKPIGVTIRVEKFKYLN